MMKEELEMAEETKSPLAMGAVTFVSFVILGFIPLIIYVIDYTVGTTADLFLYSAVMTFIIFGIIGWAKSYVTNTSRIRGMMETLFLGGSAAVLAYIVGDVLEKIIT